MKKAKVDRIIKAKLDEAKELSRAREIEAAAQARRDERDRYTMQCVPPDDGYGMLVLGEVPKGRVARVAIGPMYAPRILDPSDRAFDRFGFRELQVANFEPIMKCQQFGNGQRVVWYEWIFRGIS